RCPDQARSAVADKDGRAPAGTVPGAVADPEAAGPALSDSAAEAMLAWLTGALPMKKLVLETTAPFQGLPELVAYDEGLFEKEGLQVEWADREQGVEKKVQADVTSPAGVDPFTSHGKLFEQGKADMYNASEW